ncbi:hypothetical protein Bca52824_064983 [Brassica carinata]|uniref:RRM domain-containing protein n=1 Tax=Brassica carinata TaxID=52824 RepID=A0A8X7QIL1_BRACI|nr:hypothetical protein Bca52824_064983 [Brassica carinata]
MAFNQQNPLIPLSSLHCTFNPLFLNFFRRIQSYNNGEFFTLLCNLNCSKEEQRKQEVAETNDEKQTTTLIYPGVGFNLLATVYVGNLDPQILSINVYLPKDRMTNLHQGYGFIEFLSEEDAYWYRMGSRQSSMMGSSQVIRDSSIHVLPCVLIVALASCSSNDTSSDLGDPKKKKLYEAKLWVKPWLNFKELQNSSLMVMMPLPLLPLILDAKGDGLEDTSQFKAIYFGFSDYNDRLPSTL